MANIVIEGMVLPLIYVGATLTFSILNPSLVLDSTFITVYFLVTCTFYNVFLMLVIGARRKHIKKEEDMGHYFSLLIPAKNEEDVIEETLEHIYNLDYPEELFEVIVVDDNSTDNTRSIVMGIQKSHPNLKLVSSLPYKDGIGKASALNTGFADFLLAWRGLEIKPRNRWIIGVFDADAVAQPNMLKKISYQFNDPNVGGVHTTVRIRNRNKSLLCRLQDVEFLTFAGTTQLFRNIFKGSVALGGNGQFVRATALDDVTMDKSEEYWKKDSLTEDLDRGSLKTLLREHHAYICFMQLDDHRIRNHYMFLSIRTSHSSPSASHIRTSANISFRWLRGSAWRCIDRSILSTF